MKNIEDSFMKFLVGKEDVSWIKLDEAKEYRSVNSYLCKKCNTPTAKPIENSMGIEFVQRVICDCESKRIRKEQETLQAYEKQIKIKKLLKSSLIAERYENASFETTVMSNNDGFREAFNRCKKYCEKSSEVLKNGYGIYLFGDPGIGKTHLTACMNKELIKSLHSTLFTNFFQISEGLKSTFKNGSESNFLSMINSVDFLFLDDLGTERVQKNGENMWLQEKIFEIVNMRYNHKKSTIFSSNYSILQLVSERGIMPKTADRIAEMSTIQLKITGTSFRTNKNKIIDF